MSYNLTLSHDERKAIDWIGHRYWHGDKFGDILWKQCDKDPDVGWDDEKDITFAIPEHLAWEIKENLERDNMACFAEEFKFKLYYFIDDIV